jgi:LmbE family N-acetylglucosaminyl deacetylase
MQSVFDPGRLLVISPHLDDAALGCAMLLTASSRPCVVNVFSGLPAQALALTRWDKGCGFSSSRQAMQARRTEDAQAMQVLDADPENLDFLDSQYTPLPTRAKLAQALMAAIDRRAPDTVLMPLGLHHCDHERVRDAALAVRQQRPGPVWVGYEEVPYRQRYGVMQQLLGRLARKGIIASPVACVRAGDAERKQRSLQAYASQLRSVGLHAGWGDAEAAERYWLLLDRD